MAADTEMSDMDKATQLLESTKALAKHEILSAPMVVAPDLEEIGDGNTSPSLLGWIDVADILRAFLTFLQRSGKPLPTKMLALMTVLEKEGPEFAEKLLVTVRGVEDRGLVWQTEGSSTSLMSAIREMFLRQGRAPLTDYEACRAGGETKVVHRIAVFESHGEITNVISQTDVMRFLLAHIDELGNLGSRSLEDLGMTTGKPPVLSVNPHVPALLAYDQMARQQVSGAPVVADSGELIANLSISDLRAITSDHFGVLALPVAEFLAVEHQTAYIGYSVKASDHSRHPFFASSKRDGGPQKGDIQLFTVRRSTTLKELLNQYVNQHVHRVYLVTDEETPRVEAVITPTDVMRLLAGVW
ncbi:hypothetical protein N2152v2_009569 [Parachlorella kessleri]